MATCFEHEHLQLLKKKYFPESKLIVGILFDNFSTHDIHSTKRSQWEISTLYTWTGRGRSSFASREGAARRSYWVSASSRSATSRSTTRNDITSWCTTNWRTATRDTASSCYPTQYSTSRIPPRETTSSWTIISFTYCSSGLARGTRTRK